MYLIQNIVYAVWYFARDPNLVFLALFILYNIIYYLICWNKSDEMVVLIPTLVRDFIWTTYGNHIFIWSISIWELIHYRYLLCSSDWARNTIFGSRSTLHLVSICSISVRILKKYTRSTWTLGDFIISFY